MDINWLIEEQAKELKVFRGNNRLSRRRPPLSRLKEFDGTSVGSVSSLDIYHLLGALDTPDAAQRCTSKHEPQDTPVIEKFTDKWE